MMKLSTFERLLDRHGSDLARWPDADATAARALIAHSAEAQQAHAMSLKIDRWIASSCPSFDPACAHRAIAGALNAIRIAPKPEPIPFGFSWGGFWSGFSLNGLAARLGMPVPRLAFALVATAIGFAIGIMLGTPDVREAVHPSGLPVIASADDVLF